MICVQKRTHLCFAKVEQTTWRTFLYKNSVKNGKREHPFFYSFLLTCRTTVKDKGCDWTPAMAVAGSTLLKSRNFHMNATASLISVMVRQSGTQVSFNVNILVVTLFT